MSLSFTFPLSWHARHYAAELGLPGLAAAVLCLGCGAFVLAVSQPMQRQLDDLRQQAAGPRPQVSTALPVLSAAADPARQLADFYRFFPAQDELAGAMSKVYAAAAQHNLNLDQGEYQLNRDRTLQLARYDITLPVKGDYLQVRKFIALALVQVPSLALESVSFTRPGIDAPTLDAQLRFTLYLSAN